MSNNMLVAAAAGLALTTVVAVGTMAPARAATADDPAQACGVVADTGATACFATSAELESWVESETGTSSVSAVPDDQEAPAARVSAASDSSFLLAIFYQDANYGGASWSVFATGACNKNKSTWEWEYQFTSHNDWASSFQGFSNCQVEIFDNIDFTGTTLGPVAQSANVGAMNDRTSAARFF
jgi:hypothetical protein